MHFSGRSSSMQRSLYARAASYLVANLLVTRALPSTLNWPLQRRHRCCTPLMSASCTPPCWSPRPYSKRPSLRAPEGSPKSGLLGTKDFDGTSAGSRRSNPAVRRHWRAVRDLGVPGSYWKVYCGVRAQEGRRGQGGAQEGQQGMGDVPYRRDQGGDA